MRMDWGYVEIKMKEKDAEKRKREIRKGKKRQKGNGTKKEGYADSQLGWMKVL
jgi:hypothetical protein